jgi:hypothetical protein
MVLIVSANREAYSTDGRESGGRAKVRKLQIRVRWVQLAFDLEHDAEHIEGIAQGLSLPGIRRVIYEYGESGMNCLLRYRDPQSQLLGVQLEDCLVVEGLPGGKGKVLH